MNDDLAVYRLDRRHVLRLLGLRFVIAAALVVLAGVLLSFDGEALSVLGYVFSALAVVLIVLAVTPLVRAPVVVRLDDQGYRVRHVRDCGARTGAWTGVRRVDDKVGELGQTLVIGLEDGTVTRVPLVLVAGRARELQRDVHERLNRAHGYRKLPSGPDEADWPPPEPT